MGERLCSVVRNRWSEASEQINCKKMCFVRKLGLSWCSDGDPRSFRNRLAVVLKEL